MVDVRQFFNKGFKCDKHIVDHPLVRKTSLGGDTRCLKLNILDAFLIANHVSIYGNGFDLIGEAVLLSLSNRELGFPKLIAHYVLSGAEGIEVQSFSLQFNLVNGMKHGAFIRNNIFQAKHPDYFAGEANLAMPRVMPGGLDVDPKKIYDTYMDIFPENKLSYDDMRKVFGKSVYIVVEKIPQTEKDLRIYFPFGTRGIK